MDFTERNVIESLSEIAPYIEADGGYIYNLQKQKKKQTMSKLDQEVLVPVVQ